MSLASYTVKRLFLLIGVLFGASILVFLLIHLVPGDPAVALLGSRATPEKIAAVDRRLGLNKPLLTQYIDWITGALTGDLGTSFTIHEPVVDIIAQRFKISFELVMLGTLFAVLISIPLGFVAATRHNSLADYSVLGFSIISVSMPMFFTGVLLIGLFGVYLNVTPISGYVPLSESVVGNLSHMFLPVLTLTLVGIGAIMRMMRSSLLETLRKEYIRFLRSKGLRNRSILFVHAFKNSFIPVLTLIGIQFGYFLSGAVVIEQVFAMPGIGRALVQATIQRDYPLVQGLILLLAIWFAVVNLLTDIGINVLDPRIMEENS